MGDSCHIDGRRHRSAPRQFGFIATFRTPHVTLAGPDARTLVERLLAVSMPRED